MVENWLGPQRILVILAHPDDPEFFCGATIARWTDAGHHVTYWLLTCGDKGASDPSIKPQELCSTRHAEQRKAAYVLGVEDVNFLDYPDGHLVADLELRRALTRIIRIEKPDILVTCDPDKLYVDGRRLNHPDHRAAGLATLDAAYPAAGNPLYFPELISEENLEPHEPREIWISGAQNPNVRMDVTDLWDRKLRSLYEHKSQIGDPQAFKERMQARHTPDSTPEDPCYEEIFYRIVIE